VHETLVGLVIIYFKKLDDSLLLTFNLPLLENILVPLLGILCQPTLDTMLVLILLLMFYSVSGKSFVLVLIFLLGAATLRYGHSAVRTEVSRLEADKITPCAGGSLAIRDLIFLPTRWQVVNRDENGKEFNTLDLACYARGFSHILSGKVVFFLSIHRGIFSNVCFLG
jgi:hypothetical protein